jgi:hypothetical protein
MAVTNWSWALAHGTNCRSTLAWGLSFWKSSAKPLMSFSRASEPGCIIHTSMEPSGDPESPPQAAAPNRVAPARLIPPTCRKCRRLTFLSEMTSRSFTPSLPPLENLCPSWWKQVQRYDDWSTVHRNVILGTPLGLQSTRPCRAREGTGGGERDYEIHNSSSDVLASSASCERPRSDVSPTNVRLSADFRVACFRNHTPHKRLGKPLPRT